MANDPRNVEVAKRQRNSSGSIKVKPWMPCKYCTGPEDGPHEKDCPGDTPALLERIKKLESTVTDLMRMMTEGK